MTEKVKIKNKNDDAAQIMRRSVEFHELYPLTKLMKSGSNLPPNHQKCQRLRRAKRENPFYAMVIFCLHLAPVGFCLLLAPQAKFYWDLGLFEHYATPCSRPLPEHVEVKLKELH